MGDMSRAAEMTAFLERMDAQRRAEAKEAGFDTVEAHEAYRAAETARQWAELEHEAKCEARWHILQRSGTLIADPDQRLLAEQRETHTRAIEHARRWLASDRPLLVLCGPPGTGKSVASAWALCARDADLIDHAWNGLDKRGTPDDHEPIRFGRGFGQRLVVHSPRIPVTFDPWKSETEDGRPLMAWRVPFLVIDDLGTEQMGARWLEAFGHLIEERLAHGRCRTIITTNLPKSEIRARYGDRIADRWNAHSVAVQLKGESMRGRGQGL